MTVRFPFPAGGTDCGVCSSRVSYNAFSDATAKGSEPRKYRRACRKCRKWVHFWCFSPSEGLCLECSGPSLKAIRHAARDLGLSSRDEEDSAVLVMTAFSAGSDEASLAKATGLSPDFIRPRAERMRQSGIWTDDGTVVIDEDADMDDASQAQVVVILHTLCAEGLLTCSQEDGKRTLSMTKDPTGVR